jgi:hypothetical protein
MLEAMFVASLRTLLEDRPDDELSTSGAEPILILDLSREREQLRQAAISDDEAAFSEGLERLLTRIGPDATTQDCVRTSQRRVRQLEAVKRFEAWVEQEASGRSKTSRAEAPKLNRLLHTWFSGVTVVIDDLRLELVAKQKQPPGEPASPPVTRAEFDRVDWTRVAWYTGRSRLRGHAWDDSEIVASLHAWAEAHGRSPRSIDWRKGATNTPTSLTVLRHFGSWKQALRRAGLTPHAPAIPPRNSPWTDAEVIKALKDWAGEHRRAPKWHEWLRAAPGRPCNQTVAEHFGSWRTGVAAAGLPYDR